MKGYRDNGGAAGFGARNKTVYDDVFGGPPKFGATTLPPRLEDYTEIFQGFHASRGSSIPVLDLPPPSNESDDVWFDVHSSKLNYSEVFGGFNGLDFAISYEELFKISKVGDGDSSDDLWTPAQSETLSDELDPYTSLEMNQHVQTSDPIDLFGVELQNEPDFEAEKDLLYDSQFLDSPIEIENERMFSLASNDHFQSNHGVVERKKLKKSFSQPLDSVYDTERYKQHVSVCDLSLKTQPSNLPPPSRPPPVLSSKKGDKTKLKTSRSYVFEKVRGESGDSSPPYFDVEIDASSSSAAADAAAMKDAVEQAQEKLRIAKESMDRKKENLQTRLKNNVGDKKERVNVGCKITKGSLEKDDNVTVRRHERVDEKKQMKMKFVELESESENACLKSNVGDKKERVNLEERCNSVGGKITKGSIEKDDNVTIRRHEGIDKKQEMKMKEVESESENTCLPSQQSGEMFKTQSEVDESELCDNLIEIQLKDNDMEPVKGNEEVVGENEVKDDIEGTLWEDYDDSFEKEDEKEEVKEEKVGPPEIVIGTQSKKEEEDDERGKHEKIVEDSINWDENESDNISETASEKEQKLNHKEKILQKETVEKNETVNKTDSNSEEDTKSQIDHEFEEESEKKEEVVSQSDESDVVYTVEENIEILQTPQEIPQNTTSEKIEVTPQIPIHPTNPENNETNGVKILEETITEIKDNTTSKLKNVTNTNINRGVKTSTPSNVERKEVIDKLLREREIESEKIRKQEEERERQIEREKDRMAIDRATLEARERAFSETKEKERSAVERATAEYRQRALAEARERLEKACAEARERSLAEKTMEGRLRVEKATAEARERAERSVDDKSFNSRNIGVRYTPNPPPCNGAENESPQRCKARLERHQRTADRAAKALAEKNMRDLLAQKEQAERNRLSEGLDAEVKRWCGGKQGNLRALLSTLQYILGPDSGWQPIPLTEVITTAAVKKAYRKATLCVHPDKLQQRGASIQQKYICEKVFDLLKEAWNKFNSEER